MSRSKPGFWRDFFSPPPEYYTSGDVLSTDLEPPPDSMMAPYPVQEKPAEQSTEEGDRSD